MNKFFTGILIGLTLLLSGCGKDVLDWRNVEMSGGSVYEHGSNEPFTGKVTNIPGKVIFDSTKAPLQVERIFRVVGAPAGLENGWAINGLSWKCDADVVDGDLDGMISCTDMERPGVFYKFTVDSGEADGEVTANDGTYSLKTHFTDGKLDQDFVVTGVADSLQYIYMPVRNNAVNGHGRILSKNGMVYTEGEYLNNKPVGEWSQYYKNSEQVQAVFVYDQDGRETARSVFTEDGIPIANPVQYP
jgi:hypothetical protein